jgi:tRNA threonylcarbamoyladenosine biosynthesis protein TsaB
MLLLVTDTSGKQGSVALVRADASSRTHIDVLEAASLAGGMFSAQLVPQIAALLARHRLTKADLDAFIVVSGPGSFTGLRVGLAAIKALGETLHKPIVPVTLLEVVANANGAQGNIAVVLDAGRGEVYFGSYEIEGESSHVLREQLLSKDEFVNAARALSVITPDESWAAAARQAGLSAVVVELPNPASIARFGMRKLQAGETVSPEQLEANYMRRSDAEMFVKNSS